MDQISKETHEALLSKAIESKQKEFDTILQSKIREVETSYTEKISKEYEPAVKSLEKLQNDFTERTTAFEALQSKYKNTVLKHAIDKAKSTLSLEITDERDKLAMELLDAKLQTGFEFDVTDEGIQVKNEKRSLEEIVKEHYKPLIKQATQQPAMNPDAARQSQHADYGTFEEAFNALLEKYRNKQTGIVNITDAGYKADLSQLKLKFSSKK